MVKNRAEVVLIGRERSGRGRGERERLRERTRHLVSSGESKRTRRFSAMEARSEEMPGERPSQAAFEVRSTLVRLTLQLDIQFGADLLELWEGRTRVNSRSLSSHPPETLT